MFHTIREVFGWYSSTVSAFSLQIELTPSFHWINLLARLFICIYVALVFRHHVFHDEGVVECFCKKRAKLSVFSSTDGLMPRKNTLNFK